MNKKIVFILLILGTVFTTLPCLAEKAYYKIEILAFKHTADTPLDAQDWQGDTISPQLPRAMQLQPINDLPSNTTSIVPLYQQLPDAQWELKTEHQRLDQRRGYDILTHTAWIQTLDTEHTTPIRLNGGQALFEETNKTSPSIAWELDGIIRATYQRAHYFIVEANLALSQKVENHEASSLYYYDAIPQEPQFQHYYLKQTERLKSGELHYFDHPRFGLLVKITPYERVDITERSNS
jgi:hypothetical protein